MARNGRTVDRGRTRPAFFSLPPPRFCLQGGVEGVAAPRWPSRSGAVNRADLGLSGFLFFFFFSFPARRNQETASSQWRLGKSCTVRLYKCLDSPFATPQAQGVEESFPEPDFCSCVDQGEKDYRDENSAFTQMSRLVNHQEENQEEEQTDSSGGNQAETVIPGAPHSTVRWKG
ncbi:hypothetical protein NDU88_006776 [Pleurodeles waltl]|uniref:Uncharacterized protein n=1 Tax=Pleurodeles waltl TaxID=8319 RepID=A0AAV7QKZ8_PLEWA|nr:hypothetical protein NDU88_006776 [Pleurodeles waltl]